MYTPNIIHEHINYYLMKVNFIVIIVNSIERYLIILKANIN